MLLGELKLLSKISLAAPWRFSRRNFKVTLVGAGGGIGQPLSLLLRGAKSIRELALHDLNEMKGIATDLSHISKPGLVTSFKGDNQLESAVSGADVVIVAAGMPRLPGMQREQLMAANGQVAVKVAAAVSVACPGAMLAFITNPVNMIVPAAAEVLKANEVFDPRRLFGISLLDVSRAEKFVADYMNISPDQVDIPVIGGHAGITILPLFSQCQPEFKGGPAVIQEMTHRIQEAGTEVVKAKAGAGSATLSMAYAGARFLYSLMLGMKGEDGPVECAFVTSNLTDAPFFSSPLQLGKNGVKNILPLPKMNNTEQEALAKLIPVLQDNAKEGIQFAQKFLEERVKVLPSALQ